MAFSNSSPSANIQLTKITFLHPLIQQACLQWLKKFECLLKLFLDILFHFHFSTSSAHMNIQICQNAEAGWCIQFSPCFYQHYEFAGIKESYLVPALL